MNDRSTESISCPRCGAELRLPRGAAGRTVRCPRCGNSFSSAQPPPLPFTPPPVPVQVLSVDEWTPGRKVLRRTGIQLLIFGIAAMTLPLFGLQFRKLAALGDAAAYAGAAIAVIGGLMIAAAYAGRKLVVILLVAVPVLIAAAVGLIVASSMMMRARPAAPPPPPPAIARSPMTPPNFRPGPMRYTTRPTGQGFSSTRPSRHEMVVQRYGRERVVDIKVTNISAPNVRGSVTSKVVRIMMQQSRGHLVLPQYGPGTPPTEVTITVGPVDDLDALAKAIDFGTVTSVDTATRTISVTADPAQFPSYRPTTRPGR